MAEYIELEALRNAHIYLNEEGVAVIEIEDIPAADVQPVKHGRWETEEVNVGSHTGGIATINIFRCSCCDEENNYEWDYCPNCGAKMDGEENG